MDHRPYPNRLRRLRGRRFTQEELAEKVRVDPSTYRGWEEGLHRPRPANVRALCRVLDVDEDQLGFSTSADNGVALPSIQPLKAAIAVVTDRTRVLLVCRREASAGITWQFPAGVVKPGGKSADIAVSETFAETGIHCSIRRSLGSRVHPITGVLCEYFLCDYLAGTVENRDVVENVTATWVERGRLTSFISMDKIYPPILEALEADSMTEPVDTITRPSIVAAIIVKDDKVLLAQRRVGEGTLSWQFPAGEAEAGEAVEATAVRETKEEVDLTVTPRTILGDRVHPATGRHMVYVACQVVGGSPHVADADELAEVAWAGIDELSTYIPLGVFQPVQDYLTRMLSTDVENTVGDG